MAHVPLGFTPINNDFVPFDQPPSVSGLVNDRVPLMVNGQVVIQGGSLQQEVGSVNTPTGSWSVQIQLDKSFVRRGEDINVTAILSGIGVEPSHVALRILGTTCSVLDIPNNAPVTRVFNRTAKFAFRVGTDSSSGCTLNLVAHIISNSDTLSFQTDDRPEGSSNTATVSIINSSIQNSTPPVVPNVPVIPYHDVVITVTATTLRSYLILTEIDQAPANRNPRGSSGGGIYQDMNVVSPFNASMHNQLPTNALQRLLGTTLDLMKRVQGWTQDLLNLVHKLSETTEVKSHLVSSAADAIERYLGLLEESGRYSTDLSDSRLADYSDGNTLVQSNAVEQHNVGQFRLETRSTTDINSPGVTIASQHLMTQSRFVHQASDLYQVSSTHIWMRGEDQTTFLSNNLNLFAEDHLSQISANNTDLTGARTVYQDSLVEQTGFNGGIYHAHSNVTNIGNYTSLIENNAAFQVGKNMSLTAATGLQLFSASGQINLNAPAGFINAISGLQMNLYSTKNVNVGAAAGVHINSASIATMQAGIVLINSGTTGITVPSIPTITPIVPKLYSHPLPIQSYNRTNPVSPGAVGQRVPHTPEPNNNAIETELGSFMTGGRE
jgi:hypothetical protein